MHRNQQIQLLEAYARLSDQTIDGFELREHKHGYPDEQCNAFTEYLQSLLDAAEFASFHFELRAADSTELKALLEKADFPLICFSGNFPQLMPVIIQRLSPLRYQYVSFSEEEEVFEEMGRDALPLHELYSGNQLSKEEFMALPIQDKHAVGAYQNAILYLTGFRIVPVVNSKGKTPVQRFFQLLHSEKKDIYNLYFFAIIGALVNLSLPLGIQAIVGLMSGGLMLESVFVLMALVVAATALAGWLQIQQLSMAEVLQQRLFAKTAYDFSFRIPRLKLERLSDHYAPELVNRFFDVLNVQKSLPKLLVDFASAIVQIIFGLLLLSLYHPYFIFFGLMVVIVVVLLFMFTGKKGLETSMKESKYKYQVVYWLEELARSIQTFKLAGSTSLPVSKTDRLLDRYLHYRQSHFSVLVKQMKTVVGFKTVITGGLLIMGGALVFTSQINLGQFVASEIIIVLVINSVEKLISGIPVVYDMLTGLDKVGSVTDLEIERNEGREVKDTGVPEKFLLEAIDLTYQYPEASTSSFSKVNLSIRKGQKICLTGYNDSGKTSLLKVLAGMYQSYEGIIRLNGLSLREINPNSYRRCIGDNLSLTDVFEGTIEENIALGRTGVRLDEILEACRITGLDNFVAGLREGLQTRVLPGGINFPSSVVKKIMLARSLVQRPSLILIDEFFHNVKREEKKQLLDAIFNGTHALLIVSSLPEIMEKCDTVWVMKDGQLTEQGTYQDLKSRNAIPFS